jgi:xylan 1,4-beta-xylosidase
MGSPQNPTPVQVAKLEKAGLLEVSSKPEKKKVNEGSLQLDIKLPRQGVSLLKLEW